jgi:hypothetical protein
MQSPLLEIKRDDAASTLNFSKKNGKISIELLGLHLLFKMNACAMALCMCN